MLTVKPATTVIGGHEVDRHGIYLNGELICDFPCTEDGYTHARSVAKAANAAIDRNLAKLKTEHAKHVDSIRLLNLAARLNMNRYGLTRAQKVDCYNER